MNKFFKIFFVITFTVTLSSCSKSEDTSTEPLRDYSEQYLKDLDSIDEFLDTHYMDVDADYNVTFTKITTETPGTPIRDRADLQFKMYLDEDQDVNYKIYYIKLREGDGQRPTSVDSVHVAYRGTLTTGFQFDIAQQPVWFQLDDLVKGWSRIIPEFKTGTYDPTDGPNSVVFENYGAGVMFLPSGLGYYNSTSSSGTIAAYSPLIFSFKLMELQYKDHDGDGILSKDEFDPANPTGDLLDYDSDGDGFANMYDIDDDGDRILTKIEIKNPVTGLPYAFDDIPDCSGNTTDPNRIKVHLVKCNP